MIVVFIEDDNLVLDGVLFIIMLDDIFRGDDVVMFDIVVIVIDWVILYFMKDEMFIDLNGKENCKYINKKRLFLYYRGKRFKFF